MLTIFSHQKSSIFFVLTQDAVQIRRNFFPFGHPPYAKKSKRDSLYFDLLPGPFKSATFLFIYLFIYILNKREKEDYSGLKFFYLFVFSLT